MPENLLTDAQCRNAKPKDKLYKVSDGGGLYLHVSPSGSKVWRWGYWIANKEKTLTLGAYPGISLTTARDLRGAARLQLREGNDPAALKEAEKAERRAQSGMSFEVAMVEYMDGQQDWSAEYRANAERGLRRHLCSLLGRPIATISRAGMMAELNRMDAAGLYSYVRKIKRWAGQVFDWAIEQRERTGCVENPCESINPKKAFGKRPVENRAALELTQMPDFMRRLGFENPNNTSVLACKLMALTWARTKELRLMTWDQLDGAVWRVPKAIMKKERAHLVPLSRQARDIIEMMRARSRGSNYVFPAANRLDRPMSENAVLYLLYRMGYKGVMTGHGWRAVASTWGNENGYNVDAIEYQLSHVPEEVRGAYNRAKYWTFREPMMQAWADWLDNITQADSGESRTLPALGAPCQSDIGSGQASVA